MTAILSSPAIAAPFSVCDFGAKGDGTIDCNGKFHITEKAGKDLTGWQFERVHPMTNSPPRVVFFAGCCDVAVRDVVMVGQPAR